MIDKIHTAGRAWLLGTASYIAVALITPRLGFAEVATDGTLGPRVRLKGGDLTIGADLGQQRGGNLFHSFEKFDVETQGRVTFTGPDSVKNVIGRVTGGEVSSIDGTLASSIPNADLYLLNPAGILFGPHARLDVKGSFHASTADELRLADGAVFSALDTAGSTLSVADPRSFGFLSAAPGTITVRESLLTVPDGEAISIVGGNLELIGASNGLIEAPSGKVTLGALAAPGSINLESAAVTAQSMANIALTGFAVSANGNGGGEIRVRGANLLMSQGSLISTDNTGVTSSEGSISVFLNTISLLDHSTIRSNAFNIGDAGSIFINASGELMLEQGSVISTATLAQGGAGMVRITADLFELYSGALVTSATSGTGNAGSVEVSANRLVIDGAEAPLSFTGLDSGTRYGTGSAGDIKVTASDLEVRNGGGITTATLFSAGDAGAVDVVAGRLLIEGIGRYYNSAALSSTAIYGTGNSGSVRVTAADLEVRNGGRISTAALSAGNAGTIEVVAGRLLIDRAGSFSTGLDSAALLGGGDSGDISVVAHNLEIRNGGGISSSAISAGAAGSVEVLADQVLIDGTGTSFVTEISSNVSDGSIGNAGDVLVVATNLTLVAGSISSSSTVKGGAGSVRIEIEQDLTVDQAQIESSSKGVSAGPGGNVTILGETADVTLKGSGTIAASAEGGQAAGNVVIRALNLNVKDGVISTSGEDAAGGRITVTADDRLYLRDAKVTSSGAVPDPGASVITLRAPEIILNRSQVESLTGNNAALEGSGEAKLDGDLTVISFDSEVVASSSVQIRGLQTNLGSELQISPSVFLDSDNLLQPSCADRGAARSSFSRGGRGGLPPAPDRPLPSAVVDGGLAREVMGQLSFLEPCSSMRAE
jgi:filamentous hemagglutinin family protein